MQLARTYLDVEQIRFGARLKVEMDVDEACTDCLVPPLVLQPLIENAVKHGIATLVEGGTIIVEGHVTDGQLEVSVENSFDPDSPVSAPHGLGLRNVRSRLETRFGGAATAHHAFAENNQFRAEMSVPCQRRIRMGQIEPGANVAHYRIVSLLGAGGMGEVFLAEDTRLHRKVALKVLAARSCAQDSDRLARFVQEAQAASALSHPNAAHIYEIGEADGSALSGDGVH